MFRKIGNVLVALLAAAVFIVSADGLGFDISAEYTVTEEAEPQTEDIPLSGKSTKSKKFDLTNEYICTVSNLKTSICKSSKSKPYFYNFNDKLTTGMAKYGYLVPIETDLYGIKAEITKTKKKIDVKVYNNSNKKVTLKQSYIENCSAADDSKYFKNKLVLNKTVRLDASSLPGFEKSPKVYRIVAKLSVGNKTQTVYSYFFTNIDEVKLCAMSNQTYTSSQLDKLKARRAAVMKLIKKGKIKPSEETSVIGTIFYPYWDFNQPENYRCDTSRWMKTAKTIVTEKMSDELKIWTFYNWLTKNIAYDEYDVKAYVTTTGQGVSRARLGNDFSGNLSVYALRCGTCFDFSNIFAIFCRTYGIPTIVISDTGHAWNAVYLNGRWIEVDISYVAETYAPRKDASYRKAYNINVIKNTRRYDFDATKGGAYDKYNKNFNKINRYLATDQLYIR